MSDSVLSTEPISPEATESNGQATATVAEGAKEKKKTRNKPSKPVYDVPKDKLRTSETPGFNVAVHAKLKPADFHDPLDYASWQVWYYQQKVSQAQAEVENLKALGSTPEERNAAKEEARLLKMVENLVAKRSTGGDSAAVGRLTDRLGSIFEKLSSATPQG